MTANTLTETLQQIGQNTRKLALATCYLKDIEEDRSIFEINMDLDDGETIMVVFDSRWEGDGRPEMAVDLADVITPETTDSAIKRIQQLK